jgi:hypothetical protein
MAKQSIPFSANKGKGKIVLTHKESKDRIIINFTTHFEDGRVEIIDKKSNKPLGEIHFRIQRSKHCSGEVQLYMRCD